MKIVLTTEEAELLIEAATVDNMAALVILDAPRNNKISLKGTEDSFCELDECCEHYWQMVGFDENYDVTPKGKILESLIDKFYDYLEGKNK